MKSARSGRRVKTPIRPGEVDQRPKWVTVSFPDDPSADMEVIPVDKIVSMLTLFCFLC